MKHRNPAGRTGYVRLAAFSPLRLCIALLLLVPSAFAQETSAGKNEQKEDTYILNPYTVSGGRVSEWNSQTTFSGSRTAGNLLEIPMNISIITNEYLEDVGAHNLLGVLQYAASGVVTGVNHTDDFQIRGFRVAATQVDGLPGPFPNGGFVSMYDVDRVEVVKGPTALVYGNYDNVSGVINYVTKRPTATPQGDMSVTVGTYDLYTASVTQSGPLTADARARYRVTAGAQEDTGWRGQYKDNRAISGGFDWDLTNKLQLRLDLVHAHNANNGPGYSFIDPTTDKLWVGSANGFNPTSDWEWVTTTSQRARAELIFQPVPELAFRASYQIMSGDVAESITWSQGAPAGLLASEAPNFERITGRVNVHYNSESVDQTSILDASWKKDFGGARNRLNVGVQQDDVRSRRLLFVMPIDDLIIADPVSARPPEPPMSTWGPYLPDQWSSSGSAYWTAYLHDSVSLMNDRLIVAGGARYISKSAIEQDDKTTWVPNYGAVFRITPEVSLYTLIAESYVPRSGEDVFGTTLVDTIGESKEIGFKFNALDGRIFGSACYFDILIDPVSRLIEAVSSITGQLTVGQAQVGKETNKGFEMDLGYVHKAERGEWSTIATAYSANPKNAEGFTPSGSPKNKYTLFSKFHFKGGALDGFSVGAGMSHTGEQPGTGFPTIPPYTIYTAVAGYEWGNWKAWINVDNATDKKGILLGAQGRVYAFVGDPLTAKLTLSRRW